MNEDNLEARVTKRKAIGALIGAWGSMIVVFGGVFPVMQIYRDSEVITGQVIREHGCIGYEEIEKKVYAHEEVFRKKTVQKSYEKLCQQ